MKIRKSQIKSLVKEVLNEDQLSSYVIENMLVKVLKQNGFNVTNTFNGVLIRKGGRVFKFKVTEEDANE